jgi:hypothetical protein
MVGPAGQLAGPFLCLLGIDFLGDMNRRLKLGEITMRIALSIVSSLALFASPAMAQTANSGSSSGAISGSASNSSSVSNPINIDRSTSVSGANSASNAASNSASDQHQGQMQGQSATQTLGATQGNMQGTTVSNTFTTKPLKWSYVGTNTNVPLVASSSFSGDYCGGAVSGGASVAPIGVSIGASGNKFDKSCQSLRRAEKFGMAAVDAANLHLLELSSKLMGMMIWSICTSDHDGPDADRSTAVACNSLGLLGTVNGNTASPPTLPIPVMEEPKETPPIPAVEKSVQDNPPTDFAKAPRNH